jgi:alpha-mannosidase
MRGPRRIGFALYPHRGGWADGGVVDAAERYRNPFLTAPGTGAIDAPWPPERAGDDGLRLRGEQVSLSSLRRRPAGWIEVRVVNLAADGRGAVIGDSLEAAREADLRGEPGATLPIEADGSVHLALGPAEIRTIQVRRRETTSGRADLLDATGPRRNA